MAKALRAEMRGDAAEAEQDYLQAATIDHLYKPAWALANFYLRQNQPDKFWLNARKCLEIVEPRRLEPASYDPAPVFDLAWRLTQDAAEIRKRLIPPRHFILADYLEYLGERNLLDAGADVAMDLASYSDPDDNFVLLNFCERLINYTNGVRAVDVWNAMANHRLIHTNPLAPHRGQSLSNGDLRRPFERVGFDWRMPPAEGVLQNHFSDSGEVRFEFSGDQPDCIIPLFQSIPVVPGASYRLAFRYRTEAMEHADGLSWQIWDYMGRRSIPVACKITTHQDWSSSEAAFSIPSGVSIARLGLIYQRASGSTSTRGTIALTDFSLALVQGARS
jgi:hypothetical protein